MGGLLHLFDFNHSSMARKIIAHKQHVVDGLEAPRNSLELQVEASQNCIAAGDGVAAEDWSEKNCYPIEGSMKRLINEEISRQSNSRRNAPSIVARLMGVDMLPIDAQSTVQPIDKKTGTTVTKRTKRETNERSLASHRSSKSKSFGQIEFDSFYQNEERDADRLGNGQKFGKPKPRGHPQEEELQKFKKDFEAFQAARLKECSKVVELGSNSSHLLEQENIKQRKIVFNANCEISPCKKYVLKAKSRERGGLHHELELLPDEQKEFNSSRNRSTNRNCEHGMIDHQKLDKSAAPTRIVILKPGPDRICDYEESWTSSSGTLEERGSIEDFLEEVKERLKCELQGKTLKRGPVVRGSGIETRFSEKPSDPKQIARHIAKNVRDSVTRDLGTNLLRSESTRSYQSEIQFTGPDSPEFINRDMRRFLSERLRNVLKREKHSPDVPFVVNGSSASSLLDSEKIRLKEIGDNSRAGILPSYWEILKDEQEMQTRSFRHGDDDGVINRELSPRNLVRSLSAPVSGTSFGKLLLEDRHILTGAQIRRKHEALENVKMDMRKRKKERFNIKEKVSNFRYNFTLRGKLFGKKLQSMAESHGFEQDFVMSGPTIVKNLGEGCIMENLTEVPPSPASVCSSGQEEFWRPLDYLSPLSAHDVTPREDSAMPQVFREISTNLNELRRQLNQLESDEPPDNSTTEQETDEYLMVDLEDKVEAYIRDLLVTSGLYDGSCDKCLSRWDPLAKPISNSVFEKVEESCKKWDNDNENNNKDENGIKKVDHKLLYDLLNETLAIVLGPPVTMSRFRRKIISSFRLMPLLRGMKLLDCIWEMMKVHLYPPQDKSYYSLDAMVANNLTSTPWTSLVEDEINGLGKEMESLIIADLIEEIVNDII